MTLQPTRCLSSYLTTELFKFRNPLGAEENWLPDPQRNAADVNRNRMIAAEVGAAILCITAAIETVAYLILGIGLIPLAPISSAPTTPML